MIKKKVILILILSLYSIIAIPQTLVSLPFSKKNNVYTIEDNIDLKGKTITIPQGCVLSFDGGSLRNGTVLGNPSIRADRVQIFYDISTDITEVESDWIGVSPNGTPLSNRNNLEGFIKKHVACNSTDGNRLSIIFTKGLTYDFSSGIVLPDDIILYFEGATPLKDQMTMLRCRKKGATFITVMGGQFCATNITFAGAKGGSYDYGNPDCTVLIDYKKTNSKFPSEDVNNTDARLYRCRFRLGNIGVRLTGRQSTIKSCVFSDCNVGVLIDDIINPNQKIVGSSRNNRVSDCHFHSSIVVAIWCRGDYQKHLTIDNNIMDMAAGCFFKGNLRSGFIYNNNIHYTINTLGLEEVNVFELDCLENSFITGNKCDYVNDYVYDGARYPNRCNSFVKCIGPVVNSDITNNKFGESLDYGFVFNSTVSGLNIKHNIIAASCTSKNYSRNYNRGSKTDTFAYLIKFDKNRDKLTGVVIDGNVLLDTKELAITEPQKVEGGQIRVVGKSNSEVKQYGPTSGRPKGEQIYIGFQYFDTSLNKPVWYSESGDWVDYSGNKQ